LDVDLAAMRFDDLAADRRADAVIGGLLLGAAGEHLEDALGIIETEALPVVADGEGVLGRRLRRRSRHGAAHRPVGT
jgi:hypothetical protein